MALSRIQIVGHDAAAAATFIGRVREISVDTDNDELRVHDGVTPGGARLLNKTSNDLLYQPLDSLLTVLAALAIADGNFIVGNGATFVVESGATVRTSLGAGAIGEALFIEAVAADARTTLGLGTAAVENIGTSGANVPKLDGLNVWSENQVIEDTDPGVLTGPDLILDRNSASPAANDGIGKVAFRGRDSGAAVQTYAQIYARIITTTAGLEDGRQIVQTIQGGALADRLFIESGLWTPGAAGGDPGVDKINASEYQVDGVALGALSLLDSVAGAQIDANAITLGKMADNSVDTPELVDNAVTLAKMAHGTDGELITYSAAGAPTTVPAGTATEVLTSNGAGAEPTFQPPPVGLELIETIIADDDQFLDFKIGIDGTYPMYLFAISGLRPVSNGVDLQMLVSEDGGSTFKVGAADYSRHVQTIEAGGGAETIATDNSTAFMQWSGPSASGDRLGSDTKSSYSATIKMFGPSSTAHWKLFRSADIIYRDQNGVVRMGEGFGVYAGTLNAIDAIRFLPSSGNFAEGTISLYGVRS